MVYIPVAVGKDVEHPVVHQESVEQHTLEHHLKLRQEPSVISQQAEYHVDEEIWLLQLTLLPLAFSFTNKDSSIFHTWNQVKWYIDPRINAAHPNTLRLGLLDNWYICSNAPPKNVCWSAKAFNAHSCADLYYWRNSNEKDWSVKRAWQMMWLHSLLDSLLWNNKMREVKRSAEWIMFMLILNEIDLAKVYWNKENWAVFFTPTRNVTNMKRMLPHYLRLSDNHLHWST